MILTLAVKSRENNQVDINVSDLNWIVSISAQEVVILTVVAPLLNEMERCTVIERVHNTYLFN